MYGLALIIFCYVLHTYFSTIYSKIGDAITSVFTKMIIKGVQSLAFIALRTLCNIIDGIHSVFIAESTQLS
jgi:hypothetical protein